MPVVDHQCFVIVKVLAIEHWLFQGPLKDRKQRLDRPEVAVMTVLGLYGRGHQHKHDEECWLCPVMLEGYRRLLQRVR